MLLGDAARYRNHTRDRNDLFINEKVNVIEQLMSKRGYSHLVLAGTAERVGAIEKALSAAVRNRIIDICNLDVSDKREKIVRETIHLFVEEEIRESLGALDRLAASLSLGESNTFKVTQRIDCSRCCPRRC